MRISDWSPDVCSSDLLCALHADRFAPVGPISGVERTPKLGEFVATHNFWDAQQHDAVLEGGLSKPRRKKNQGKSPDPTDSQHTKRNSPLTRKLHQATGGEWSELVEYGRGAWSEEVDT